MRIYDGRMDRVRVTHSLNRSMAGREGEEGKEEEGKEEGGKDRKRSDEVESGGRRERRVRRKRRMEQAVMEYPKV